MEHWFNGKPGTHTDQLLKWKNQKNKYIKITLEKITKTNEPINLSNKFGLPGYDLDRNTYIA